MYMTASDWIWWALQLYTKLFCTQLTANANWNAYSAKSPCSQYCFRCISLCKTMLIKVNPLAGLGSHFPLILYLGSYPTLPVDRPSRVSSYALKGGEYNGVRYETNSPISQHLLFLEQLITHASYTYTLTYMNLLHQLVCLFLFQRPFEYWKTVQVS